MALLPPRRAGSVEQPDFEQLDKRAKEDNTAAVTKVGIIIAIALAVLLCGSVILFFGLRWARSKYPNPKYIPSKWLKRKWRSWQPSDSPSKYSGSLQSARSYEELRAATPASARSGVPSSRSLETTENPTIEEDEVTVERHTSVRSVMTLPAYSSDARPTEKVIGREGERAGIDSVVEFPESETEAEAYREETMESLYQIRSARRAEIAEREERRQRRREARMRGDTATLTEMARESRLRAEMRQANASQSPADILIAEHQARGRERRVSSVSYAELGVARHDGSRVRANSHDSDNLPLLDSAASMGGVDGRPSTNSLRPRPHFRDNSNSSYRSYSPGLLSEDDEADDLHNEQAADDSRLLTPSDTSEDARRLPPIDPPQYTPPINTEQSPRGEAPPYESPSTTGAPRLPGLAPMPSIEIIPNTPVSPTDGYYRFGESLTSRVDRA